MARTKQTHRPSVYGGSPPGVDNEENDTLIVDAINRFQWTEGFYSLRARSQEYLHRKVLAEIRIKALDFGNAFEDLLQSEDANLEAFYHGTDLKSMAHETEKAITKAIGAVEPLSSSSHVDIATRRVTLSTCKDALERWLQLEALDSKEKLNIFTRKRDYVQVSLQGVDIIQDVEWAQGHGVELDGEVTQMVAPIADFVQTNRFEELRQLMMILKRTLKKNSEKDDRDGARGQEGVQQLLQPKKEAEDVKREDDILKQEEVKIKVEEGEDIQQESSRPRKKSKRKH